MSGKWLPLLTIARPDGPWLGLLMNGQREWGVSRTPDGPARPIGTAEYIPCWPLLESDLRVVQARIQGAIDPVDRPVPDFPYREIATSALTSGQDYWADLALGWAEELLPDPVLVDALRELSTQRSAPQAVRHRALKLAARARRAT